MLKLTGPTPLNQSFGGRGKFRGAVVYPGMAPGRSPKLRESRIMPNDELDYSRIAELHINKQDETVGIYAAAFLDAASVIFEHGTCDFAPYPGMYCLRHGLELFAKQLTVYAAYELRDKRLLYRKGHGLLEIWERVKCHVDECVCGSSYVGPDGVGPAALERIDDTIRHIHAVDPGGMLYRYPEDMVKGKGRVDTHFPEDRFDLSKWKRLADALLADCQLIECFLSERCTFIQHRRKEYGPSLYDIVAAFPSAT